MKLLPRALFLCALAAAPAQLAADCLYPYFAPGPAVPADVTSITTADLNGDGRPDLIGGGGPSLVIALNALNGGSMNFPATATTLLNGSFSSNVIAAELTGGGGIDLAVAALAPSIALYVLPGNGDGTFGTPVTTSLPGGFERIAAADFNNDGKTDIAAISSAMAEARVFLATTGGAFSAGAQLPLLASPMAITAGDINGDGKQDLVTASMDSYLREIHFGNGNGTFAPVQRIPSILGAMAIAIRDMDGDGMKDLVSLSQYGTPAVQRNLQSGSFGDPLSYAVAAYGYDLAIDDLTGDAIPDLAIARDLSDIVTFSGTGTGTMRNGRVWAATNAWEEPTFRGITAADFDADGRIDLAVAASDYEPKRLQIIRNECGDSRVLLEMPAVVTQNTQVTVTARVTVPPGQAASGGSSATGTITIKKGDTVLGSGTITTSPASVNITLGGLPEGTHPLVAHYGGDAQHEPNTSTAVDIKAVTDTSTVFLDSERFAMEYGTRNTITANATSTVPGDVTGKLTFEIDGKDLVGSGIPSSIMPLLGVGTRQIAARYSGDATHPFARTASPLVINVTKGTPVLMLRPVQTTFGTSGTLTVNANPPFNAHASTQYPTGSVSVYEGQTLLAQGTLVGGRVDFAKPALPIGRHSFRIVYSGDANYKALEDVAVHDVVASGTTATLDARGTADRVRIVSSQGEIFRKLPAGAWERAGYGDVVDDYFPAPGVVYLYAGWYGNAPIDVAMRVSFTDDLLQPGTSIRALHLTELVTATNQLRTAAGLAPITLSITAGHAVSAQHVQTLRNAINNARTTLGAYAFPFTGSIGTGDVIRAWHIQELREAVR
jgi:hypothetical protein